jgi:flavin-dependent thymidylate synthase
MGDDLEIVRAARQSYDAAWRAGANDNNDMRLIDYLIRNKHTSPFEVVEFQFEVVAPIFVLRQWHRHRTWCLDGQSSLVFTCPCNGKAYQKNIRDVVNSFSDPRQRPRVIGMQLRAPGGSVNVTDAWYSGEKKLYTLTTKYGSVTSSADHIFKTPDGEMRLGDAPSHVMAMVRAGRAKTTKTPVFTEQELISEKWIEFADGYEASSLGRVRSYWGQGVRIKRFNPIQKIITINKSGRAVVSVNGKALQVSHLVFEAFIGSRDGCQVLHRDDDPFNNRVGNLYGGSPKDNSEDQYVNGGRVFLREVPVEVVSIDRAGSRDTFDISVTGDHWFCANNLVVHNSYSEVSARYTELSEKFYVPEPGVYGAQSQSSKQARDLIPSDGYSSDAWARFLRWEGEQRAHMETAFTLYRKHLSEGMPRELARIVLPFATYSGMSAKVDLHNLLHFLELRQHQHAQYEIRVYAEAIIKLIEPIVPVTISAWRRHITG